MHKRILLAVLLPLICGGQAMADTAPQNQPAYTTERLSQETLDTLLAPIALYPDTLVTHILIASTYPLQVVEADRWRQANKNRDGDSLEQVLSEVDWDPSVKALIPFTDILHHMSDDLTWLQQLGDAVLTNEDWVLDRVQALRLQAQQSGNLQSNDYQQVSTEEKIIVIESRQPEVVYVPYYDTRYVYGNWHYHTQPIFWPTTVRIALGHRIYWGPHVSISAGFYFGNIWWPERHIVIRSTPVHHYVRPVYHAKRSTVREYHRWQHNVADRHARYSKQIVTHKPKMVEQHRSINTAARHRELYTKTRAVSERSVKANQHSAPNSNKPQKHTQFSQDAQQLKQRLKNHQAPKPVAQHDRIKSQQPQVKPKETYSTRQHKFAQSEQQRSANQLQSGSSSFERKMPMRSSKNAERVRQKQTEGRQNRPVRQSQSKPSRPEHGQRTRPTREH